MATWLKIPEVGPVFGMRILTWLCRTAGRRFTTLILHFVVFYYFLFAREAKKYSKAYLARVGLEPSASNVYRHIFAFAQTMLDRLFFVSGNFKPFSITRTGHHHLEEAARDKRGTIILGAHLGSFEAMRASSEKVQLPLVAVGYFKNAAKINGLLDEYGENSTKLVHVEPGTIGYLIQIKQLLAEGHLVALLGDRDIGGPTVEVEFLGGKTRLPIGAYALSSQLGAPILVAFGLYTAPNRYDLYCEPLGTIPFARRKQRDEVYKDGAQRYAHLVEKYCRKSPFNWFNFYDYWI